MVSIRNARTALAAASKFRVQGVTTQQTVKSSPGVLRRIVASNADAAAQTLTLVDGASTLIVLRLAAGTSQTFELGVPCATDIRVTPSHASVDALMMFD